VAELPCDHECEEEVKSYMKLPLGGIVPLEVAVAMKNRRKNLFLVDGPPIRSVSVDMTLALL
jgi:hypothetical protein